MRIERDYLPEMTIEQFAEQHNLVMRITVSTRGVLVATFKGAWISDAGMLRGSHGTGITEAGAIADYARVISEQRLVIDVQQSSRREIRVPRLTPTAPETKPAEPRVGETGAAKLFQYSSIQCSCGADLPSLNADCPTCGAQWTAP